MTGKLDKDRLLAWLNDPNRGAEYKALNTVGRAVFLMAIEQVKKEINKGSFDCEVSS
ncbi:hypothetical protein [Paenibacillus elgii]|uniref:hypothetical protein n=1 Tax=Paenibacillus elgii TaxID=189691 RepID=UPI0013D88E13|nr:hypothetical protein [Paenibacillus elgii]